MASKAAPGPARRHKRVTRSPVPDQPIARVAVDVPLPHLDRPFDYLVPDGMAGEAVPGTRVRVRFSGQLVDGFILERVDASDHAGRLSYLERVTSSERVLTPEVARLVRAVADRYAGTLADVLRLAVAPRHARAEAAVPSMPKSATSDPESPLVSRAESGDLGGNSDGGPPPGPGSGVDPQSTTRSDSGTGSGAAGWGAYRAGVAYLRALRDGRTPRAVVTMLAGEDWPGRIAEAVAETLAGGHSAVVVVPDARDLDRLGAAVEAQVPGKSVTLAAALGPAERYRRFLAASRAAYAGVPTAVIGTRAAMFAPVAALGLVVVWDDGDDLHAEPRAPYPHTREVLLTRAQLARAGVLVAGFSRTAEAQLLLATGWAQEIVADRALVRACSPRVVPVGDDADLARDPAAVTARLPSVAWRAARDALASDAPVLVQVPRRGYLPSVTCAGCRRPARCPVCSGPLALAFARAAPACRWCGHLAADFGCPHCGNRRVRAAVIGAHRTAEELGRAFPEVAIRTSGRNEVLTVVPSGPALVVATPGAEPLADGGYGAALLLDTWALLTRTDLRAGEEALRRWLAAACLVRPAGQGGRVVVVADGALAPVQALIRLDPGWHAERELAERRSLGFPPAVRMASLTGTPDAVADLLELAELPPDAEVLGPVPVSEDGASERVLVRVSRSVGPALAAALHAATGVRSARKATDPVRVQIDPLELF